MKTTALLASLVVMSSMLIAQVQGVLCNRCNSLDNSGCGTSLTYSPSSCSSSTCFTYKGTANGNYIVMRDCLSSSSSTGCVSVNTYSEGVHIVGTYCYCSWNYCNGGRTAVGQLSIIVLAVAISTRFFF